MAREVLFQECIKRVSPNGLFEEPEKEIAFVIGNGGHAVVRVPVLEVQAQVGVVGVDLHHAIHFIHKTLVAQGGQHFADVTPIDLLHDALLEIHREAFVEPKVIPGCVRDQVAAPAVGQFMCHQSDQATVASNDGGGGEGESRILHAAKGKGSRQHEQVVAFPRVFPIETFSGHQHVLHLSEFVGRSIDEVRSGVDARMVSHAPESHIADGKGQQIRWDGLVHHKAVVSVAGFLCWVDGTHQCHQIGRHLHVRIVGETDARTVLTWHPCSGQDGLALREQEGSFSFDPKKGRRVRRSGVRHADGLAFSIDRDAQGLPQKGLLRTEFEAGLHAVHHHRGDVQSPTIEQNALGVVGRGDLVLGGCRDLTRVEVNLSRPTEVGGDGLLGPAEAVVVRGSFHVSDGLGFGRRGRGGFV